MQQWLLPGLVGALTALAVVLGVALTGARRNARAALAQARSESLALQARLDGIERRLAAPTAESPAEFVITDVGEASVPGTTALPARIEGRLFADLVLRESVVRAAALLHGVRRACSPENRHRLRYEFAREVKSSRKQRRAELRRARRHLQSIRRAGSEDAA